jgi:hypothetical protein
LFNRQHRRTPVASAHMSEIYVALLKCILSTTLDLGIILACPYLPNFFVHVYHYDG